MRQLTRWPYADDLRGRALYFVKGYDRMKREADELIAQAPVMDGQPRGTQTGDPVAAAAIRRERIRHELSIIEGALLEIEPEYRAGVLDNVARGRRMYDIEGASVSTWKRKRLMFLAAVVERAGWADPSSAWRQM